MAVVGNSRSCRRAHGWGQFLLPYLEQTAMANNYSFLLNWTDPANQIDRDQPRQSVLVPLGAGRSDGFGEVITGDPFN